jgi:hypothetical protein
VRSRFHFRETGPVADLLKTLDGIARRGSQGVILKAPDVPEVTAAVARLVAAGIPVVTLVTDLPASARTAYIGIDNRAAGATAAYLIRQWLGDRSGAVLVTISRGFFRGEEEREMGFRSAMRSAPPARALVEVTDSDGLDATQGDLVLRALRREPGIDAVYSIGGGNTATAACVRGARPGPRQHAPAAGAPVVRSAPPRPAAGHAARLPDHHAGTPGAAGRGPGAVPSVADPGGDAVQHAAGGRESRSLTGSTPVRDTMIG